MPCDIRSTYHQTDRELDHDYILWEGWSIPEGDGDQTGIQEPLATRDTKSTVRVYNLQLILNPRQYSRGK
jgi:hypothetical protein